jgi:hypothetical protein
MTSQKSRRLVQVLREVFNPNENRGYHGKFAPGKVGDAIADAASAANYRGEVFSSPPYVAPRYRAGDKAMQGQLRQQGRDIEQPDTAVPKQDLTSHRYVPGEHGDVKGKYFVSVTNRNPVKKRSSGFGGTRTTTYGPFDSAEQAQSLVPEHWKNNRRYEINVGQF